jgi:hypothetical protein
MAGAANILIEFPVFILGQRLRRFLRQHRRQNQRQHSGTDRKGLNQHQLLHSARFSYKFDASLQQFEVRILNRSAKIIPGSRNVHVNSVMRPALLTKEGSLLLKFRKDALPNKDTFQFSAVA